MSRRRTYKYRGRTYRSQLELGVAKQLAAKRRRFEYEKDKIKFETEPEKRTYLTDFKITTKSGHDIYVETKGRLTSHDRKKYLAVRKSNPGIDLRFVFGRNNMIGKSPKNRYSDWCEANGFKYAFEEIPSEWLDE